MDSNQPKPPTLKQIARRDCARKFSDPKYVPPTFQDVRDLMAASGVTGAQAAAITGCEKDPTRGSRTVRRWTADPAETGSARQISYSAWRLLLIETGAVAQ